MSNIKISEMAEAESLNDNDLLTIVQSGVNKKITKQNAIGDIIQAINNPTYTTTEGTNLSINNTRVGKMKFEYFGNTEQNGEPTPDNPVEVKTVSGEQTVSVIGKNFFDKDNADVVTGYVDGTTGEIVLGGTSKVTREYTPIIPNTNMNISGFANIVLAFYDKNKTFIERVLTGSNSYTFNKNAYYIRIQGVGDVFNANTIQLEKGSTASTYEPYQSQSYEINLGKNLTTRLTKQISYNLNGLYAWWEGNTIGVAGTNTKTDANWTVLSDYVPIMPNFKAGEIYTLSAPDMPTNTILAINYIPTGSSGQVSLCICDGATKKITFTVPSNYGSMGQIFFVIKSTVTTIKAKFNYMLEKGSQATNYVPYLTPIELCKIGDYQDYIYNNGGKWYKHQEIGKLVIDGSDGTWSTQTPTGFYRYGILINELNNTSSLSSTVINYSNYFKGITFNNRNTDVSETIYPTTNNADHQIWFNTNVATTLDGFKTWLSTHNTIVYYVLATPTEIEITEPILINQLNAIKYGAESYYGTTNIMVTSEELQPTLKVQTMDKIV